MALAQFQESMPATTKYHALVRSEEEAEKLRFDLAGVKVVEGLYRSRWERGEFGGAL